VASAYLKLFPELEAVATEYVVATLGQLGVAREPGQRLSVASLVKNGGIIEQQRPLAGRLLEILAEEGLLRRVEDEWEIVRSLPPAAPAARLARLLQELPQAGIEAALLGRCGDQLAAVLRGTCDPLPLLFPPAGEFSAEMLYRDAPGAQAANNLVAEAVAAATQLPPGRRLRVLEIGAGTGGTTAAVLPGLPPERTDYVFSDVSAGFLAPARDRFAAYPFVDYRVLDIERDPLAQGLGGHGFDLVLAANVLHATGDLRRALRNVRQLLAPSGLLLLLEGTRRQRWLDLIFGLLEGWWKFADTDLRPTHPLLSAAAWRQLLAEEGFTEATCLPEDDQAMQALIVARGPATVTQGEAPAQAGRRLVFTDPESIGSALAERLAALGGECVFDRAGRDCERLEEGGYRVDVSRPAEFKRLLAEADAAGTLAEVVCLCVEGAPDGSLPTAVSASCARVLRLVQALARAGHSSPLRLVLVTRGAQGVVTEDRVDGLAQAPLAGLARVITREHPELRCQCIDLDPAEEAAEAAQRLVAELSARDDEDQLAFRGGQRYAARLVRSRRPAGVPHALAAEGSYLITGGLGGLGLQTAQWLVEQGARHLVLLGRSPPSEAARERVAALERAGAAVVVTAADVSVEAEVSRVLEEIARTLPPLRGIIHAAGVLDDGVLLNQTRERFETVLAAKVAGSWHLHRLTEGRALDFFVVYSSVSSLLGSPGQGNHAAANAFLDALAHHRQARALPALSINWGAWGEVGEAARRGVPERLVGQGLRIIDPASGLAVLERVLGSGAAQVGVMPADWERLLQPGNVPLFLSRLAGAARPTTLKRQPSERTGELAARLRDADPRERPEMLVAYVQEQVARVLALRPGELPERKTNFFELGMDSLMAVELRNRLHAELGGPALDSTVVFDHPTVEGLAARLRNAADATPASPLVPIQPRGSRPPFFCVHPGFGFLIGLTQLAHHLGNDQPFFGLQARGLRENEVPLTRVEDMAALYREAICRAQPTGPIYLGGWSAGGNIAFEMARQLQRAGRHLALFVLLDTSARYPDSDAADAAVLEGGIHALVRFLGSDLGQPLEELEKMSGDEKFRHLLRRAEAVDSDGAPSDHLEGRVFEVLQATGQALKAYKPRACSIPTVLFRAAEQPPWAPPGSTLGWNEWIKGPLEVREVPGDHYTMVRKPHVQALAEQLRVQLDTARLALED
jgi:thioesterase domain-containing protein/NAD(P)-dependent dehydrogenase (short-subunit alcohol dehydrogenase family)